MLKVLIAAKYDMINYGTMLQSYALQYALEQMGIFTQIIDETGIAKTIRCRRLKYVAENCLNFKYVSNKLGRIRRTIARKTSKQFCANDNRRKKAFKDFATLYFSYTEPFVSMDALTEACKSYDAVLVGSDQLWLPINIAGDYYTLSFVPECVRKISYATSFGIASLPPKYERKAKTFLNRIDMLSVREKIGVEIIEKSTGREATLVCDPTLLLSFTEWIRLEAPLPILQAPYLFCYLLGNNSSHRDYAKRLAQETGCKIVMFKHLDDYIVGDEKLNTLSPYDVGPCEFLSYLHYAEFVVTDSFHGVIFSLIYHKRFIHFNRHQNGTEYSTNSRIKSILNVVGIPAQSMSNAQNAPVIPPEIDYEQVQSRMDAFRASSIAYLSGALGMNATKEDRHSCAL